MKIVLEFDSVDEFLNEAAAFMAKTLKENADSKKDPNATVQKTADIINAAEAKMEAEKKTKAVPFKEAKDHAEEVSADPIAPADTSDSSDPEVDESYRVEVRRFLAKLNKKTGENTASKLITEFKAERLTDVALKDLPALMKRAQEVYDA